ncbi:MAG TPA: type II toxin-antitoxin system RelE/ParE family toxin [Candidatus Bathyarchaeia archaeon]|nr:type II toxin-antitoxin system RelE/ParE family toxin [Candidatus Bathyarchaeia archaeon]
MAHRLAPRAEADLDDIWYYVANDSGSVDTANRLIDTITERFLALASFPYLGRSREDESGSGFRSLAVGGWPTIACGWQLWEPRGRDSCRNLCRHISLRESRLAVLERVTGGLQVPTVGNCRGHFYPLATIHNPLPCHTPP